MEVSGSDGKKVLWVAVENHAIEEGNEHGEIGIQGFYFGYFEEDREVVVREGLSEYPYLLILINICPEYCKYKLEKINMKLDK